ncbi:MAG: T9SS type A sorting domain-containing protein [Desulfobacterales bacterium]|nr:T9SS type A sorting domain-containing protein [Desulfobacterales bacterium]
MKPLWRSACRGSAGKVAFNAGDLTSGIYFYSLVVNGNSVATKKLIVRD